MKTTSNHTFSILFWVNKHRANSENLLPIYMRITIDGKRVEVSMQRFIKEEFWDQAAQKVKNKVENGMVLNSYLDLSKGRIQTIYNQMISSNEIITAEAIKNRFSGKVEKPKYKTIFDAFEYHNLKMAETVKVGKVSAKTLLRYKITQDKVVAFMKHNYKCSDKPLPEVRLSFVTELEHYLLTIDKISSNTAHKYIKNFKKIMNLAVGLDWIPSHPLKEFKCSYIDPEREILYPTELTIILEKTLTSKRLDEIRDTLIFGCYTGFAYSELYDFESDAPTKGLDGSFWLSVVRGKTGKKESVPLLPIPLKIIEKYKNHPYCVKYNKLLPVNSNQRYNEYLKELMAICGINKHITTHTARHTFATTITLANGVPIESVMSMLGHTNIRTTQIYAKVVQKKVSDDMNVLKEKLQQPNTLVKNIAM
jgi:site-specific recombinase XerD